LETIPFHEDEKDEEEVKTVYDLGKLNYLCRGKQSDERSYYTRIIFKNGT